MVSVNAECSDPAEYTHLQFSRLLTLSQILLNWVIIRLITYLLIFTCVFVGLLVVVDLITLGGGGVVSLHYNRLDVQIYSLQYIDIDTKKWAGGGISRSRRSTIYANLHGVNMNLM